MKTPHLTPSFGHAPRETGALLGPNGGGADFADSPKSQFSGNFFPFQSIKFDIKKLQNFILRGKKLSIKNWVNW